MRLKADSLDELAELERSEASARRLGGRDGRGALAVGQEASAERSLHRAIAALMKMNREMPVSEEGSDTPGDEPSEPLMPPEPMPNPLGVADSTPATPPRSAPGAGNEGNETNTQSIEINRLTSNSTDRLAPLSRLARPRGCRGVVRGRGDPIRGRVGSGNGPDTGPNRVSGGGNGAKGEGAAVAVRRAGGSGAVEPWASM